MRTALACVILLTLACSMPAPEAPPPKPAPWVPYVPPPRPPEVIRDQYRPQAGAHRYQATIHELPLEQRCQDPRRTEVRAKCRHSGGSTLHGEAYKAFVDGGIATVQPDDLELRSVWDCPEASPAALHDYARFVMPSLDRECAAEGL